MTMYNRTCKQLKYWACKTPANHIDDPKYTITVPDTFSAHKITISILLFCFLNFSLGCTCKNKDINGLWIDRDGITYDIHKDKIAVYDNHKQIIANDPFAVYTISINNNKKTFVINDYTCNNFIIEAIMRNFGVADSNITHSWIRTESHLIIISHGNPESVFVFKHKDVFGESENNNEAHGNDEQDNNRINEPTIDKH